MTVFRALFNGLATFRRVLVNPQAGLGPGKILTLVGWLIGCGAVVFLWQRPSSVFFAQASLNR